MKSKKRVLQFIFSFTFLGMVSLYSESFRVSKVTCIELTDNLTSDTTAKIGINEALAIKLPAEKTFIEGIELKFDIPETVAYWMDSVACSVYANIKPTPTSSQIDYNGTRAYVSTLPGKLSWVLQIPLRKDNSIKSNNYVTKVDTIINPENNVIFVRLQPVMKGIPEETLNSKIPITIKTILSNKGQLELNVKDLSSELKPCTIFIDDKIDNNLPENKILLESGIHNISIISEYYRNEVRTVRIDQGKTTTLEVQLKSIEPTMLIKAPEGTKVFLDDEKCTTFGTEFVITEGEHKIRVVIGDYELVRSITAIKGKTYKADFTLDLQINEE